MVANANPVEIKYTWTKDGQALAVDRIPSDGSVLNISRLARSDAGIYTCHATNSQGSATINITVVVECKYRITVRGFHLPAGLSKRSTIYHAMCFHFPFKHKMEPPSSRYPRISSSVPATRRSCRARWTANR